MIDPSIPPPLAAKVERELERGENITWIGMPQPAFFTGTSIALFCFAIPWTLFSLFWMAGASGFQIPTFNNLASLFPLFGVPFVLIGVGLLSAPLWIYRNSFRTVYVITDRRAIIIEGGWSTTIRSFAPAKLTDLFRKEKNDGSGDIIIVRRVSNDAEGSQRTEWIGFARIADVQEVERKLKRLAERQNER